MLQRFFHGVKCPGYRTLTNVEFPPTWDLIHVKCPGVAQDGGGGGGMGILGFDSYIRKSKNL